MPVKSLSIIAIAAGLLMGGAVAGVPGLAANDARAEFRVVISDGQVRHYRPHRLSRRQVYRRLHRHGYRDIHSLEVHRHYYLARGFTRHGRPFIARVNVWNGEITRLRPPRHYRRGPVRRWSRDHRQWRSGRDDRTWRW